MMMTTMMIEVCTNTSHIEELFDSNFHCIFVRHCIMVPALFWVVRFPPTRGEDVLVSLVPVPQTHLPRVRFVLLHARVVDHAHVLVNVEAEQRAALTARLHHDEVVEGVVVQDDQVLHVHELR
jgi:hypothetical protein